MSGLCLAVFFLRHERAAGGTAAASQVTAVGMQLAVFLPPEPELLFLGAPDAEFPHLFVVAYLGLGEFPVLAEDYVEAKSGHAQSDEQKCR